MNRLAPLTHAGAAVLVGLYGSGFLVVSLHHASYGIFQFELLRARVISAGILFFVFLAISAAGASQAYGLFGSKALVEERRWVAGASIVPHISLNLSVKAVLSWTCFFYDVLVAFFMSIFLEGFDVDGWKVGFYVGFCAIGTLALMVLEGAFAKKPIRCALLALLMVALGLTGLILLKSWTVLILAVWFWLCGRMLVYVSRQVRDAGKGFGVDLHKWVVGAFALVGFFALSIYPKISPAIGGGFPPAVEMQFADKPPFGNSSRARVWLIDENDKGFYILRSRGEKKAVFLRRDLISAIYYGD